MSTLSSPSPSVSVALRFLTSLTAFDLPALRATLSPTFTHVLLPASFGAPQRDADAFFDGISGFKGKLPGWKIVPLAVNESPGKVWIHARSQSEPINGAEGYSNEYVFMFTLSTSEGGEVKIGRLEEFMDTLYMAKFFGTGSQ